MYELDTHTGEHEPAVGRKIGTAPKDDPARPRWGRVLFGLGAFLLLAGAGVPLVCFIGRPCASRGCASFLAFSSVTMMSPFSAAVARSKARRPATIS